MTRDQIIDLLSVAAAFDQRTVGEADVAAWSATLTGLDFTRAREAIIAHYREHSKRVMPADIRQHIRTALRPELTPVAALPQGSPQPPNNDYLKAKDAMIAAATARDLHAMAPDPRAGERAAAWIDAHVHPGYVMPDLGSAMPRWAELPGDPPELRAELARKRRTEAAGA